VNLSQVALKQCLYPVNTSQCVDNYTFITKNYYNLLFKLLHYQLASIQNRRARVKYKIIQTSMNIVELWRINFGFAFRLMWLLLLSVYTLVKCHRRSNSLKLFLFAWCLNNHTITNLCTQQERYPNDIYDIHCMGESKHARTLLYDRLCLQENE